MARNAEIQRAETVVQGMDQLQANLVGGILTRVIAENQLHLAYANALITADAAWTTSEANAQADYHIAVVDSRATTLELQASDPQTEFAPRNARMQADWLAGV